MNTCSVKFLKAVDGHPVGRVIEGVVLDAMVEKWADMGLIEVQGGEPEPEAAEPEPEPEAVEAAEGAPKTAVAAPVAADDGEVAPEGDAPPPSAVKAVWRDFLDSEGIEYPAGATKAAMIEAWEAAADG